MVVGAIGLPVEEEIFNTTDEIDLGEPYEYPEEFMYHSKKKAKNSVSNAKSYKKWFESNEKLNKLLEPNAKRRIAARLERAFLEDKLLFEASSKGKSRRSVAGRRRPSLASPPLTLRVDPEKQKFNSKSPNITEKRSLDSKSRVKRRKRRALVPNPRLYQPTHRPQPLPPPPYTIRDWSPPPNRVPQETASQIALNLSKRTLIPFAEFLSTLKTKELKRGELRVRPRLSQRKKPSSKLQSNDNVKREILHCKSPQLRAEKVSVEKPRFRNTPDTLIDSHDKTRIRIPQSKNKLVNVLKDSTKYNFLPSLAEPPNQSTSKAKRYQPRSRYFRGRIADLNSHSSTSTIPRAIRASTPPTLADDPRMTSTPQHSFTPEEGSDANDSPSSAPSEYLAEFLSAIMSRKYGEALKYCRLILHYEPHNATARGFYPLLQQKLGLGKGTVTTHAATRERKMHGNSTSEESSSGANVKAMMKSSYSPDVADDGEGTSDSDAESAHSLASLSLDSSEKSSRSGSPVNRTDSASEGSAEAIGVTGAEIKSAGACWLADDNGNPQPYTRTHKSRHDDDDLENDNAAGGDHKLLLQVWSRSTAKRGSRMGMPTTLVNC